MKIVRHSGSVSRHYIVVVVILGLTGVGLQIAERRTPGSLARPLDNIPAAIADWSGTPDADLSSAVLATLKPTSYLNRIYRKNKTQLSVFIAYYAEMHAGESIHTPKHCLPGGGWEIGEAADAYIPFAGSLVKVNKYVVQNGHQRLLILYWYHSKVRVIANEYSAKLYLARDAVLGRETAASIVRIAVPDRPGAEQDAVEFAARLLPEVQACFGHAGTSVRAAVLR